MCTRPCVFFLGVPRGLTRGGVLTESDSLPTESNTKGAIIRQEPKAGACMGVWWHAFQKIFVFSIGRKHHLLHFQEKSLLLYVRQLEAIILIGWHNIGLSSQLANSPPPPTTPPALCIIKTKHLGLSN